MEYETSVNQLAGDIEGYGSKSWTMETFIIFCRIRIVEKVWVHGVRQYFACQLLRHPYLLVPLSSCILHTHYFYFNVQFGNKGSQQFGVPFCSTTPMVMMTMAVILCRLLRDLSTKKQPTIHKAWIHWHIHLYHYCSGLNKRPGQLAAPNLRQLYPVIKKNEEARGTSSDQHREVREKNVVVANRPNTIWHCSNHFASTENENTIATPHVLLLYHLEWTTN